MHTLIKELGLGATEQGQGHLHLLLLRTYPCKQATMLLYTCNCIQWPFQDRLRVTASNDPSRTDYV